MWDEKKSEVDPDTGFGAIPAAAILATGGFGGHDGQQDPGQRHEDVPGTAEAGPVTERRSITRSSRKCATG